MSIDSKLIQWTEFEEINTDDLINLSKYIVETVMADMFEYIVSGSVPMIAIDNAVSQDTGSNYQTKLAIFWALDTDGKIIINSSQKINSHDTPTTNPRIDIIEIQRKYIDQNSQTRNIVNPSTGDITPTSVYTELGFDVNVQVTKGTESATPVAPVTTSGWMKVAEVYVDTAGGIADADIYNITSFGVPDNRGWTTEKKGTILVNSLYARQMTGSWRSGATILSADADIINGHAYIADSSSRIKLTPISQLKIGDVLKVMAKKSGGWEILGNQHFYIYRKELIYNVKPGDFIEMTALDGFVVNSYRLEYRKNNPIIPLVHVAGGASPGVSNVIDYYDASILTGNAVDRGDLTVSRYGPTGISGPRYGFYGGGQASSTIYNVIDYIDHTLTTGNAVDRGDMGEAVRDAGGTYGFRYGFWHNGTRTVGITTKLWYIDMTVLTGNTVDRGRDYGAGSGRWGGAGASGPSYGYHAGGFHTVGPIQVYDNVITYIDTIVLAGDAVICSTLTVPRRNLGGVHNVRYGFFGGGWDGSNKNEIDYIDMTYPTGASSDRGDLTVARFGCGGTSGPQYGFFNGGYDNTTWQNVVDYIDMTVLTGNATDRGDLTVARGYTAGV